MLSRASGRLSCVPRANNVGGPGGKVRHRRCRRYVADLMRLLVNDMTLYQRDRSADRKDRRSRTVGERGSSCVRKTTGEIGERPRPALGRLCPGAVLRASASY